VQPTHHVAPELQQQCPHGHAATATGDFLCSFSEPFERFLRPYDSSSPYLKAEKGAVGQVRDVALLAVDHQLELGFDESPDAPHHPLGGVEAPDLNQEVVGITRKALAAPFQFVLMTCLTCYVLFVSARKRFGDSR